jgi:hypothetical protein
MFNKEKYTAAEKFETVKKINMLSFALLLPLYIIGASVYLLQRDYGNIFATFFKPTFFLEIIILAVGVFVILAASLLVKAVILSAFAGNGFESVKFKIIKDLQKPYCCLAEPIKVRQYQIALAVYILIMGIMPYIISLILGDFIFILASFVCAYFAGADILLLASLGSEKSSSYIIDFDGLMLYRIYEEIK